MQQYLIEKVENKRKEMLKAVMSYGINSERTLKCSQELDELILLKNKKSNIQVFK